MATQETVSIGEFLQPLHIDVQKCHALARSLCITYVKLAKESEEQFLPTPISDSVLRPEKDGEGRYLAIDIGGTNLRVGFIELQASVKSTIRLSGDSRESAQNGNDSCVLRHLEKSWPIGEQLKNNQAEDLFAWIGGCLGEVVRDGCAKWPGELPEVIPLGVTFSFPMVQHTLSDATLMAMGKGFAMNSNLDLGKHLLEGYSSFSIHEPSLPQIKITAIANDAVATLISFAYQLRNNPLRKPSMGLIVGTGTNATIPLSCSKLHFSKHPTELQTFTQEKDPKITVNTEWTIKGAAPPLHEHNIVTKWDAQLDSEGLAPGFQPFEYMTAGRYIGELGRLIIVDYFVNILNIPKLSLPAKLATRNGLRTEFLGFIKPGDVKKLNDELPPPLPSSSSTQDCKATFRWDEEKSDIVYATAKAIQIRGSAMIAAAILGLLACADELDFSSSKTNTLPSTSELNGNLEVEELLVGYTGGCIDHFQDYLKECQEFLDEVVVEEFGEEKKLRVVLEPCHDGGIIGAGVLARTVENMGI